MNYFTRILMLAIGLLALAAPAFAADLSPLHRVDVKTAKGDYSWNVELASDDASRATGLMNRPSMPLTDGMLFRFEETRPVAMWMKNTLISLDMVFASASGQVTHIHRSAVPHSLDIIDSNGPVKFVLEVNAGQVDRAGVVVGDQLKHPWFQPVIPVE